MKAILEAPVEVWNLAVFAELAVWESRPDLQALCTAARRQGGLDDPTIDLVVPGLSSRARQNLLRSLVYTGLIDASSRLTPLGRHCADRGEAPSWEQGVYHLLVAVHPLFESQLLDFKRAPTDAFDRDYDSLEPIPAWLQATDRVFTSAFDPARRFSLAALPSARGQDPVCRGWEMEPAKLQWEIDPLSGANQYTIQGSVGPQEDRKAFKTQPESIDEGELAGLYARWESRWDPRLGRVAIPFEGKIPPRGRESFLQDWRYKRLQVGRFGSFDSVVVQEVPVGPATDADARNWASAILVGFVEEADTYVAPQAWRAAWADQLRGTPLEGRAGQPPAPDSIDKIGNQSIAKRTRWQLTAAADLSMES